MKRIAIGFFDGVHLGHQAILAEADVAITFRNHPLTVLEPARAPVLIMSFEERLDAIRACGVREVVALDFTRELAACDPDDFIDRYLLSVAGERFAPSEVVVRCGANGRFGRDAKGDADFLRARGIAVETPPYAVHAGEPVSSSRIRAVLGRGELAEAAALLGRSYSVGGVRLTGKGLGRRLGSPTVNVSVGRPLPVPFGVYAVRLAGERALANYGFAPTLAERAWREPTLEIHFPGRTAAKVESLLGGADRLTVGFDRFVRPERAFATLTALQAQIALDIEEFRSYENEH